jgi:hypothetical protein
VAERFVVPRKPGNAGGADAPLPFRKEWRRLVTETGKPNRRLYETAVLATLRNKLRSGDVWVERSSNYRRFDSYLLPAPAVTPIAAELDLPATADEWLETRGRELDRRLRRFAQRLPRGQLEGVEMRDERLHVAALKAVAPAEAEALADRLDTMMPRVWITDCMRSTVRQVLPPHSPTSGPVRPAITRTLFSPPSWPMAPIWGWRAWPRPARA